MAAKKPDEYIPLERLIVTGKPGDYERNLGIERKRLVDALESEQIKNARENLAHKDRQRAKAKKPRRSGGDRDSKPTLRLVARVVRQHPPETPPEDLIPHVRAAIEDNGSDPITDKWAKELIRRARAGL